MLLVALVSGNTFRESVPVHQDARFTRGAAERQHNHLPVEPLLFHELSPLSRSEVTSVSP